MFGIVPKTLWEKTNPADEFNRIELALRTLLIESDNRKILVDTGIGDKFSDKYRTIYGIDHERSNLKRSLREVRVEFEDITDVILTHLHFDHAGGASYLDDTGKLQLTFPDAVHYVQKTHWEWVQKPSERDAGSCLKENISPLKDGKLELVDGDASVFGGVDVIVTNGHTYGHQLVKVHDADTAAIFCGDLIPTVSHLKLPYTMGYDLFPLKTVEEKRELLDRVVEQNWIVIWDHDLKVGAGRIKKNDAEYRLSEILDFQ